MLEKAIFSIKNSIDFETVALQVFKYQYEHVAVYRDFCKFLNKTPYTVTSLDSIPFLPIEFFKSHKILSSEREEKVIFTSSGTTGSVTSKHYVPNITLYEKSFITTFQLFIWFNR